MKHISALSILALCIYSSTSCMEEITISNGTITSKHPLELRFCGSERTNFHTINVHNQTDWIVEARIEGFGVADTNSKFQPYQLNTGGVNIQPQGHHPFSIPESTMQFPVQSTLYRLYAHALMVKYQDNDDSEIHFPAPLDAPYNNFIVKCHNIKQGPRLKIENQKK